MSDLTITAIIVYQSKRTGEKSEVRMGCTGIDHAKLIAKKLRPKHSIVLSVRVEWKQSLL